MNWSSCSRDAARQGQSHTYHSEYLGHRAQVVIRVLQSKLTQQSERAEQDGAQGTSEVVGLCGGSFVDSCGHGIGLFSGVLRSNYGHGFPSLNVPRPNPFGKPPLFGRSRQLQLVQLFSGSPTILPTRYYILMPIITKALVLCGIANSQKSSSGCSCLKSRFLTSI